MTNPEFDIRLYVDAAGISPVTQWVRDGLTPETAELVVAVIDKFLAAFGEELAEVAPEFGGTVEDGLNELVIDRAYRELATELGRPPGPPTPVGVPVPRVTVRVYWHLDGRAIVLLEGYDAEIEPHARHGDRHRAVARTRLADYRRYGRAT